MGCSIRGCRPRIATGFWARRPAWACTNPRRGSGRTISAAASPSGSARCPSSAACFPIPSPDSTPDHSIGAVNRLRPGVNRVSADQMSYHLHILLRYELEQALIGGGLAVRTCPPPGTSAAAPLLGVVPAGDREGVLQDVHWSLGMFGYFPTYTLGSLYAAQLVESYDRGHRLEDEIRRGDFAGLLGWLRKNLHLQGQWRLGRGAGHRGDGPRPRSRRLLPSSGENIPVRKIGRIGHDGRRGRSEGNEITP